MKKKLIRLALACLALASVLSVEVRNAEAACFNRCYTSDTGALCCDRCCEKGGSLICSDLPVCS
ncbi:MAG TPA: hypothetical protein VG477_18175 [Thermoanaerobaculia bacterium]|nr:hypothetical protein [Thermoanaerobaculia bacterium]